MWREVLKGKNVTRGKSNDGLRIGGTGKPAESLQHRDEGENGKGPPHHRLPPLGVAEKNYRCGFLFFSYFCPRFMKICGCSLTCSLPPAWVLRNCLSSG